MLGQCLTRACCGLRSGKTFLREQPVMHVIMYCIQCNTYCFIPYNTHGFIHISVFLLYINIIQILPSTFSSIDNIK